MAIGHLAIRTHSRKHAHTAAAALAYRHGVRLECSRSYEVHDYRRRARHDDIAGDGIVSARPTPLACDLDTLARAIEAAERRGDARLLRDVQLGLPHELDAAARLALTEEFARYLAERYDTVCAFAVHRPDRRGDARNHHAHLVLPTRALNKSGEAFGAKLRQLDLSTKAKAEVQAIRSNWQRVANVALEAAGERARVHTGRAPDGVMPQPTLGPACTAIERRARPEAPEGTPVAALVRMELPEPATSEPEADAPLTWRGATRRAWDEPEGRRDRERLQSPDPEPVVEDLVATVAPTAVVEGFRQDRPAGRALAALAQPAAAALCAAPRFEGARAAPGPCAPLRRVVPEPGPVPERALEPLQSSRGPAPLPQPSTHPQAAPARFEGRLATHGERLRPLRRIDAEPERKPGRLLEALPARHGPAPLRESAPRVETTPERFQGRPQGVRARGPLPQPSTQPEAAPARFEGRLATHDERLRPLRRIDAEPESKPERLLEALSARHGPAPLRESATRVETTPERFQGRPQGVRARGAPLPRVDAASRAAPVRFAQRLALQRRLTALRPLAVAPPSAPERFRERLAAQRERRRLRRVEVASERGPERTLASLPQTLTFGLAPLRQPSIAEERARAPDKRRRQRRAASRRRLAVVRKLSPLRRPGARSHTAPGRFRARLAARRRVFLLRRPVPAPHAAPQHLPAQDLAAEAEAVLNLLEAERQQELYGSEAVQLAGKYWQATAQHGPVKVSFEDPGLGISTVNPIRLVDEQGRSLYAGRHSIATLARMYACLDQRPEDVPVLERTLKLELAQERARALQRSRGISR